MAIEKVPYPASVPAAVTDYQKQNVLIEALVKAVDGGQKVVGSNVVEGAVFNVGGTLYVATADTAISGVASDFVKLTPSGDTLTLVPSFVASLSGVAWNAEYKGYYDGSGNLYEFDEKDAIISGDIATGNKSGISPATLSVRWAMMLNRPSVFQDSHSETGDWDAGGTFPFAIGSSANELWLVLATYILQGHVGTKVLFQLMAGGQSLSDTAFITYKAAHAVRLI